MPICMARPCGTRRTSASNSISADTAAMRSSNRCQSRTSSAMRLTSRGDSAGVFELGISGGAVRNGTTSCRSAAVRLLQSPRHPGSAGHRSALSPPLAESRMGGRRKPRSVLRVEPEDRGSQLWGECVANQKTDDATRRRPVHTTLCRGGARSAGGNDRRWSGAIRRSHSRHCRLRRRRSRTVYCARLQ